MLRARDKIKTLAQIIALADTLQKKSKRVVTTNGCFDILHIGHVRNLEKAKSLGDILVVGVNSDTSVRANKGPGRPVIPARERAEVVAALACVDYVLIFNESTPNHWLAGVRPYVHVKGADRPMEEIVERDVVRRGGGKIVLLRHISGKSTTNVLKRISYALRKQKS